MWSRQVREAVNEYRNRQFGLVGSWCSLFGWLSLRGSGLVYLTQTRNIGRCPTSAMERAPDVLGREVFVCRLKFLQVLGRKIPLVTWGIDHMPERTIDVCGQAYKIQVYCLAKRFWIAVGDYLGEQLRTRGSTSGQAIMAWRRAAECTHT